MDSNARLVVQKRIERTIAKLNKNRMKAYYVEKMEDVLGLLDKIISNNEEVSVGGSMSLFESGVIEYLRNRDINFLDRYQEGLTKEDIGEIYKKSYFCDHYLTSSNAVTENGELYNIDGTGNRVSAMIYGPKSVIVVVGFNKIVKNLHDANTRLREVASPANAIRLSRNTPCVTTGVCSDCNSPERICSSYVVLSRQQVENRIKVIIVGEELGY